MKKLLFLCLVLISCTNAERDKREAEQKRQDAIYADKLLHYPIKFKEQDIFVEKRSNGSREVNYTMYAEGFKDTAIVWDKIERDGAYRCATWNSGDMYFIMYYMDKKHCPKFDSNGDLDEKYDKYLLGIYRHYATGQTEFERYLK